ncbi:hypothetical protein TRFO_39263 [Tritrichomonas foetus]|uniref:Uncharacterized protein n=1 Tax=Tritrichomonas foetus TaxID=1144522 RepID=A0A1J4J5P4_9EUKA|nr:hypothetical protein TRFO_39263 [Tritrichomonas foetus]|eukprot:OHS94554.1 hypothetical protein TRFO_39263 [Tritrichomonas foetus]
MNFDYQKHQFLSPLSVCFYGWEDLPCPDLQFSCFFAVKYDPKIIEDSETWNDHTLSNVIFAGTESGVILSHKIMSDKNNLISFEPFCFLFGHSTKITSFCNCKQKIYNSCITSLSQDGSISIISVYDQTVIKNIPYLFSENSQDISSHGKNSRFLVASQAFGTIEIADIFDETLLMRVSGFTSTIYTLTTHGQLTAVSCIDGSVGVFSINQSVECLYSFQRNENLPCFSIISPQLSFLLIITKEMWAIYATDNPLITKRINNENDSFTYGKWVNDSMFTIQTKNGHIEIWKVLKNQDTSVIDNMQTSKVQYLLNIDNVSRTLESQIINSPIFNDEKTSEGFKNDSGNEDFVSLVWECDDIIGPFVVTDEGFLISSNSNSLLSCQNQDKKLIVDLTEIFKSEVVCRCAVGDPITNEAKILKDFSVFLNNKKIGNHQGANLLFSPGQGSTFFSFSNDGSVKAWTDSLIATFYDLCEPISKIKYIAEKGWIIVIGKQNTFSVINSLSMRSIVLCSGHNSPVIEVNYMGGLFHALCESTTCYSWNVEGKLVSKRMIKVSRPIKHILHANNKTTTNFSQNQKESRSENNISSLTENDDHYLNNKKGFENEGNNKNNKFYKIVPLVMPNCQTYAISLDILSFLKIYNRFDSFHISTDPELSLLVLLWRKHIGEARVHIDCNCGLISNFGFVISGDKFSVTIPIKRPENLPFSFSPLTTTVHAVAPSTLAQCYIGAIDDENLSVITSMSQTTTTILLKNSVRPSFSVLASYLLFPNEHLRTISVNLLSDEMENFGEEASNHAVQKVVRLFGDWSIVLPFVLIHCNKYSISEKLGREAADNIFPIIFQRQEIFDLLLRSFKIFSQYIGDLCAFFQTLIHECIKNTIPESKVISLALIKPFEFYVVAFDMQKPEVIRLIVHLFERWFNPDRSLMNTMINHAIGTEHKRNTNFGNQYNDLFAAIAKNNSYFAYSRNFVAFGGIDGIMKIISKENGQVVWSTHASSGPISCVSFSPNGSRVVIVTEKERMLTWVGATQGKSREPFELIGSQQLPELSKVTTVNWKSESKIVLKNACNIVFEGQAPKMSFLQKVADKLVIHK